MNTNKPVLKLSGIDGNAFVILGHAARAAKSAGWTTERWASVREEAMSGDYDHLIQTLMEHFEVV